MRKLKLLTLSLIFLQSCQVYKPVGLGQVKNGRRYIITHENGQVFEAKCEKVNDENIVVLINEKTLSLPKSEIDKVEKSKVSPVGLLGGLALTTIATILIIKDADQETLVKQISNH